MPAQQSRQLALTLPSGTSSKADEMDFQHAPFGDGCPKPETESRGRPTVVPWAGDILQQSSRENNLR